MCEGCGTEIPDEHRGSRPAKYLTACLEADREAEAAGVLPAGWPDTAKPKTRDLFRKEPDGPVLDPEAGEDHGEVEEKVMEVPYGKETIPWATFVSSSFFTLSPTRRSPTWCRRSFGPWTGNARSCR